jgi:hypothetical protein
MLVPRAPFRFASGLAAIAIGCAFLPANSLLAQGAERSPQQGQIAPAQSYADLADLADETPLVIVAKIRRQAEVEPERAPGLSPENARLYIEARTVKLLSGTTSVGESLRYLVDVPRNAKGKPPKLKKSQVILFARPVAGAPKQLQLVEPDAQLPWSEGLEAQLRPVLTALVAPDSPPQVTGVSDALSVAGTLVGESETQLFLATKSNDPVSITVVRRPGQPRRWGVSWTEIVDSSAAAPQAETLEWYRLACALPDTLPSTANLARDAASRQRAAEDYAFVMQSLGPCLRNR